MEWAEAISKAGNPFAIAISRYARAPIAFVREILGAEPDEWQIKALRALAHGHTRLALRSAHGVGKTCFASWCMVWFANTRLPFKIVCTAPSAPQLNDALWPELLKWFGRLPKAWRDLWNITSDHITLKADSECFISARTSRSESPEAMQGVHSAHVFLCCDEASAISENVFESASGSMSSTGAVTLLIGNPTRGTGFFWRACTLERDRWFSMKVSGHDSPRVSPDFMREMADRYGIESNTYKVRCLGEFPSQDDDTLIPAAEIDAAMQRDVPLDLAASEYWGLDVARFGDDSSVLIKRRGHTVTEMPRRWRQLDTMQLSGQVKAEWDRSPNNRPALIAIDVIGIGAGVVDRLNEQGLPILGINVAETSSTVGRYMRLRDELWGRCREWIMARNVRLPYDERLRSALASPRFSFLSDGRMQVESKNSMRARGLGSPDEADALCLTFCDAGLGVGSGMSGGLFDKEPLRMTVPGLEV